MNSNNQHKKSESPAKKQNLFDKKMREKHEEDLGFKVPSNYFSNSQKDLLEKVNSGERSKLIVFSKRNIGWSIAAAVALLITLNVFKTGGLSGIEEIETIVSDTLNQHQNSHLAYEEKTSAEDDMLVSSLFIDDSEIDNFIDSYVLDDMMQEEIVSN